MGVTLEVEVSLVIMALFPCLLRPEVHLAIARRTFQEAGWGIAEGKIQLGWQLRGRGRAVCARGDGASGKMFRKKEQTIACWRA